MQGTAVRYLDRIVSKENFRTFVYGKKGEKKLVKSWEEYNLVIQSGIWFSKIEDYQENKKVKQMEIEKKEEVPTDLTDEMVFEVIKEK